MIGTLVSIPEVNSRSFSSRTSRWASAGDELADSDRLWRQYLVLVDLYKYYLDVAWKVSVWYYATTGAVLAFVFDRLEAANPRPLIFVLIFLGFMSVGLSVLCFRASRYLLEMVPWLEHCAVELALPGRPHVEFASLFLLLNALMCGAVAVASLAYFFTF